MDIKYHGSLFNGVGGFQVAAAWMGWENIMSCEIDTFCNTVTKYHFPNCIQHGDIKQTDFTIYRGRIDILTGGFPCQPNSVAGARKGIEDDRWLWPETRRVYNEIRPRVLVLENVGGLLTILEPTSLSEVESKEIGLFREDEDHWSETLETVRKRAVGTIIEQIREDGYVLPEYKDGTPIIFCIPAAGVNAPHRRDRIWFVAYSNSYGYSDNRPAKIGQEEIGCKIERNKRKWVRDESEQINASGVSSDTNSISGRQQLQQSSNTSSRSREEFDRSSEEYASHSHLDLGQEGGQYENGSQETERYVSLFDTWYGRRDWQDFPTQPPVCGGDDGIPRELDFDAVFEGVKHPRRANPFGRWRNESIKAYGNAIVPQVAYQIFKAIDESLNDR